MTTTTATTMLGMMAMAIMEATAGTTAMADDRKLRRLRRGIQVLGALAVVLVAATAWLVFRPGGPLVQTASSGSTVQIGGPFELVSHTGAPLSDKDVTGKPFMVFFGFTHCPEVCPTTLWEVSAALGELDEEAADLRVLFVSIDPERDTPEALANYLQSFDERIVGLTGSTEDVAALATAYRAFWRKVPLDDGDYTMDHTASVYLMDAQGQFFGTIAYEEEPTTRLSKIRRLIETGAV